MGRTGTSCWLVSMTVLLENVSLIRFLICVHLRSSAFISVHLRTISSLHTGPHAPALTNHRQSPLMGELLAVLLEQPFGVDAVPLERATPEVVDEQVMSHGQLETGPACSLCQVVVVEEPQPELLVEPADCLVDRPLHEQAEPGQLAPCEPLPSM